MPLSLTLLFFPLSFLFFFFFFFFFFLFYLFFLFLSLPNLARVFRSMSLDGGARRVDMSSSGRLLQKRIVNG